jgi:hypothetical protein
MKTTRVMPRDAMSLRARFFAPAVSPFSSAWRRMSSCRATIPSGPCAARALSVKALRASCWRVAMSALPTACSLLATSANSRIATATIGTITMRMKNRPSRLRKLTCARIGASGPLR